MLRCVYGTLNRRLFLGVLSALVAAPLAFAQAQVKLRRVGWLTGGSPRSHEKLLDAFRSGLREYGWIEGRNITLELRWAEGKMERLPVLAAELVRLKPEVIVTAAVPVHQAVKKETSTIPIVMATGADPVEAGLVTSLARPDGNITGISGFFEATPIKMIELAGALVPRGARVAILVEKSTFFARTEYLANLERTANAVGMRPQFLAVATPEDVSRALGGLEQSRPATVVILSGPMLFSVAREMVAAAEALKVPVIYPFEESVEAGGLMSYAAPLAESYRRAAYYVDRILKGAKPAELPIELPTRLALTVNLKRARALRLQIPPAVMHRADRVIE